MIIIGVDFHPEFQEIASVDTETGEYQEQRLTHPGRSRAVLSFVGVCGSEGTRRHGGQRAGAVV